jgi:hypothetical protein
MRPTTGGVAVLGQGRAARGVATIVVAGGLLAGGCQTDREITRPEPAPVTEERLSEALVTEDDVPSPYELADGAEPLGPEIVPEHDCDDELTALAPAESVDVTFTGAGIDTTLTNTVSYFSGGAGQAASVYNSIISKCRQVVVDDAGLSFTTKPLDFGVLSDDTLPLVVSLESSDGSIEERNVIVIVADDLISTIRLNGPRPTDLNVLDQVTRVAIGNLGLLAQET